MLNKILCFLGLHDDQDRREVVFKSKLTETVNTWEKCRRCKRETKKMGFTHVGPIEFSIYSPPQREKGKGR